MNARIACVIVALGALAGGCKKGPPCQRAEDHSVIACLNNIAVTRAEVVRFVDPAARGEGPLSTEPTRQAALEHALRVRLFSVEARRRHLQAPERAPVPVRELILHKKLVDSMIKEQELETAADKHAAFRMLYLKLRAKSRLEVFEDALANLPTGQKAP